MNENSDSRNPGRDFESEARERLAAIETRQETLQDSVEELAEGQETIIDGIDVLDDDKVEAEKLAEVISEAEENTRFRQRTKAVLKAGAFVLTLTGAFSGALVLLI